MVWNICSATGKMCISVTPKRVNSTYVLAALDLLDISRYVPITNTYLYLSSFM